MLHKKIEHLSAMRWQTLAVPLAALLALGGLYLFRLGRITHDLLSSREAHIHNTYRSIHNILHNPLNAPYKLIDYVFLRANAHNTSYARLTSVLVAFVAIGLFYATLVRWHGRRAALLGSVLFAASGWMLHMGRLGTPDIMYVLVPLSLLSLAAWTNATEQHGLALAYMTAVSGLAFYTPGAIWFLVLGYILIHKAILKHVRNSLWWERLCCSAIVLILAGILANAIVHTPTILRSWLLLPAKFPGPIEIVKQWFDSAGFLFVRGPYAPDQWLAHAPVFDIFSSALCLIGIYFYARHFKNLRTHVLVGFLLLGSILTALNGVSAFGYIVPLAYFLVGTGLTYFLHRWLTVFPRNPLARGLGVGLIAVVVAMSAIYHMAGYFVAWRYNPSTVSAFQEKP